MVEVALLLLLIPMPFFLLLLLLLLLLRCRFPEEEAAVWRRRLFPRVADDVATRQLSAWKRSGAASMGERHHRRRRWHASMKMADSTPPPRGPCRDTFRFSLL